MATTTDQRDPPIAVRQLVLAGSTRYLSLPRDWARQLDWQPHDLLEMRLQPDGSLTIRKFADAPSRTA